MNTNLKLALIAFAEAAQNLTESWQNEDKTGVELHTDYPFDKSFDVVTDDIIKWNDSNGVDFQITDTLEVSDAQDELNGLFDVLSPDGFTLEIEPEGYKGIACAKAAIKEWAKRFEHQGYYSSSRGRIPLYELEAACKIIPFVPFVEDDDDDETQNNDVAFQAWFNSDVIKCSDGYREQSSQYKILFINKTELYEYFKKEF